MGSRQDLLALPKVVLFVCAAVLSGFAQNMPTEQMSRDLRSASPEFTELTPRGHASPALSALQRAAHGIDSLPSFSGHFQATGVDDSGKKRRVWKYNIAGKSPQEGGTTVIDAPIVPVSLDLLNYDGNGHTLRSSIDY